MKAIINGKLVFPERIVPGTLLIDDGRIVAAGDVEVPAGAQIVDAKGLYVGPGLIDQHIHGYQQYGEAILTCEDPVAVAGCHLKHGTTTLIPTIGYSESMESHMRFFELCRKAIESGTTPILGVHMEGPFINKRYGAKSDLAMTYSDEICEKLFSLGADITLHCTYAPELETAKALEEKMRKYHIRPAIGHTGADPESVERAVANGATIVTHLYDAMGGWRDWNEAAEMTGDPQDSTSNLLLATAGLYYELICDSAGAHVTKYNVRKTLRCAGEDYVILISDATVRPTAGKSGDINFNDRGQLSGSRLCINMAIRNFMRYTGADIRVAFKCGSTNSAKALGLDNRVGSILPGRDANILLVDDAFTIHKILFRGEEVAEIRN